MHGGHGNNYPTLREILRLPAFAGCHLCGGAAGAEQPVQGANITEVPDYDNWIAAGELLITTGFALAGEEDAVFRLLKTAKERGLCGVCIKPGRYLPAPLPTALLQLADGLSLPLVELPGDARFSDLAAAVAREIARRQVPAEQERWLTAFLRHLLTDPIADDGAERQTALEYGLRLERPHRVIRMVTEEPSGARLAAGHLAEACRQQGVMAWTAFSDETPMLLLEEPEMSAERKLRQAFAVISEGQPAGLRCGVGQPYSGPEGIRVAEKSARAALARARALGLAFVTDDPAGLLRLTQPGCGQQPTAYVRQQLGPLLEQHRPRRQELLETLESWFRCQGNQREMARTMHLHYNTVSYRLRQLWTVLGGEPDCWERRLALETALYLLVNRGVSEKDGN